MPKSKKNLRLQKTSTSHKILIVLVTCVFIFLEITTLTEQKVSKHNTTIITGHFERIEKRIGTKSGISYDLYISENSNPYKIVAAYTDCFDYDSFIKEISPGQIINFYISNINFFRKSFVTDVYVGKLHYLNASCVNGHIQNDKIFVPIISLLLYPLFIIFITTKKVTLK